MAWWMIDLNDRVGQRVLADVPAQHCDTRFRKVQAESLRQALTRGRLQLLERGAIERRFARLIEAVRRAANLTRTEAVGTVHGYVLNGDRDYGGEAVAHFGGSLRAIEQARQRRRHLRAVS